MSRTLSYISSHLLAIYVIFDALCAAVAAGYMASWQLTALSSPQVMGAGVFSGLMGGTAALTLILGLMSAIDELHTMRDARLCLAINPEPLALVESNSAPGLWEQPTFVPAVKIQQPVTARSTPM